MANSDSWQEYRRRRNLSLFALVGYVPFVGVVAIISLWLIGTAIPAFIAAIAWMVFALVAGNWFIRFRCPRCGEPFFADSKWWGYNTFARRCLHCKLPINAPTAGSDSTTVPANNV